MAIRRYLAMTDGEFSNPIPDGWNAGWMACHFSPYGSGLTNLPKMLPTGSLLILNDRIPPSHCDIRKIFTVLEQIIHLQGCTALLLDFQRRDCPQLQEIADKLITLPCPVAVSLPYAKKLTCPVFLPPVPLLTPVNDYLSSWAGREIWLEVALTSEQITVDRTGSRAEIVEYASHPLPFRDDSLLCHYQISVQSTCGVFRLQRTRQDLADLINRAKQLGVTTAVGLWQELK